MSRLKIESFYFIKMHVPVGGGVCQSFSAFPLFFPFSMGRSSPSGGLWSPCLSVLFLFYFLSLFNYSFSVCHPCNSAWIGFKLLHRVNNLLSCALNSKSRSRYCVFVFDIKIMNEGKKKRRKEGRQKEGTEREKEDEGKKTQIQVERRQQLYLKQPLFNFSPCASEALVEKNCHDSG